MTTNNAVVDFYTLAEELAWTANAYLDGAIRVCEGLIEDEHEKSSHHFLVPIHLAYLAFELYLKAGVALGGKPFSPTHDFDKLQRQYDELKTGVKLPMPSYFTAFIPTSLDLFQEDKAPTSAWHFERLRYSSKKDGTLFPRLELADLPKLKEELDNLHRAGLQLILKTQKKRSQSRRKKGDK